MTTFVNLFYRCLDQIFSLYSALKILFPVPTIQVLPFFCTFNLNHFWPQFSSAFKVRMLSDHIRIGRLAGFLDYNAKIMAFPKWGQKWGKFEKKWWKFEEKWGKWNTCPSGTVGLATSLIYNMFVKLNIISNAHFCVYMSSLKLFWKVNMKDGFSVF